MNREIKLLEYHLHMWEKYYEESLQTEELARVAYISGVVDGFKLAIKFLQEEDDKR